MLSGLIIVLSEIKYKDKKLPENNIEKQNLQTCVTF